MKRIDAISAFESLDRKGLGFFSSSSLGVLFDETGSTLRSTIKSLVEAGVLQRVSRNLYRYAWGSQPDGFLLEQAAVYLRRGHYCFESLESAAAKWGIISQMPLDRITVMTTGREGEFHTPFGTIEFIHTAASAEEILANTREQPGNPLRIATREYTERNMRTCRRSAYLIEQEDDDG